MNTFFQSNDRVRIHKTLPKSKVLMNNGWQTVGGNASATPANGTPYSPACHSLVCQQANSVKSYGNGN